MWNRRVFIQRMGLSTMGIGLLPSLIPFHFSNSLQNEKALPRSTPELQGVSSAGISRFLQEIEKSGQEFHSLMILRHGQVITEAFWAPYQPTHTQQLYSLSKSFTSTAIGLAVGEGLLSVEDAVVSFFPELAPSAISSNLAALKVKHLLSMSVGHEKDAIMTLEASGPGVPWEKTFLNIPVMFEPGTKFLYNSGASYMLSSIVKKVTGQTAHQYLKTRIYEPLNIEGATWTENWEGVNMGASHLRIRTEDIAKFGQLYLQKGVWNGKQLLKREWVEEATKKQISNGQNNSSWAYGYGYQFWMNPPGGYRADGAFGQFSMVLPELDAVVAITSESIDTKTTMQMVWEYLLPEMKGAPLAKNNQGYNALQQQIKGLKWNPPTALTSSPLENKISGKEYLLEENPFHAKSVTFSFTGDTCLFTLKEEGKEDIKITGGKNYWITKGNFKPAPHSLFSLRRIDFDSMVAASATWKNENTLLLTWRFIQTVHGDSLTCVFEDDKVTIQFLFSVARLQHKKDDRADLIGRMKS